MDCSPGVAQQQRTIWSSVTLVIAVVLEFMFPDRHGDLARSASALRPPHAAQFSDSAELLGISLWHWQKSLVFLCATGRSLW